MAASVPGISKLFPNTKYLVAYIADSISEMNEPKRTDIETMLYTIREEVGELADLLIPPKGKENENNNRFKEEHGEFFSSNVETDIPCLVVAEDDFASFDWKSCRWAVIALSSLFDENRRTLPSGIELKPGRFGFSIDLKNFFSPTTPAVNN